jgi:hypothetical protein
LAAANGYQARIREEEVQSGTSLFPARATIVAARLHCLIAADAQAARSCLLSEMSLAVSQTAHDLLFALVRFVERAGLAATGWLA